MSIQITILNRIGTQAKIQISFGKIIHVVGEKRDEIKYYHPKSRNLDNAVLIDRMQSSNFISNILPLNELEDKVMGDRKNLQSQLIMLTNAKLKEYQLDKPVGFGHEQSIFPDWLLSKNAVIDFTAEQPIMQEK